MSDAILIATKDPDFGKAVKSYYTHLGFRVLIRDRLPDRPARVQICFADINLGPDNYKTHAANYRATGSEFILAGHWIDHQLLREMAKDHGLQGFVYPVHPRALNHFIHFNRFGNTPQSKLDRIALLDIAGQLYVEEGFIVDDVKQFTERVNRRQLECGIEHLDQYRKLIHSDPAECSLLSQYCSQTGQSLFEPTLLYQTLEKSILPQLPDNATVLCLADDKGVEAFSLLCLLQRYPSIKLVATSIDLAAKAESLPRQWLRRTPRVYRQLVAKTISTTSTTGPLTIAKSHFERVHSQSIEQLAEDTTQKFDLIIARRLDLTTSADSLELRLRQLAASLTPNGLLVVAPGERVLISEWPLKPEQFGPISCYRNPPGKDGRSA